MEWIEVQAKSVDEAVELALDRLGIVADELEYEVLDESKSGLFRRGSARIRARVKPLSREKPADKRRRRRGGNTTTNNSHRGNGGGRSREAAPAVVGGRAEGDEPKRGADSTRDSSSRSGENRRPRRRRGSGSGNRGETGQGRGDAAKNARDAGNGEAEASDVDSTAVLSIDEQADAAVRFTDELVQAFGLTADVGAEVVDDDIELRVDGEGSSLGVLVGPKGATLHALEELVRAVVQHAAGGQSARLHLDVAGYRERRRTALAAFAVQVATEVRDSGTERALEPMSPPDRKVVHDAVTDLEGVATTSVGEEPRRRVVIKPV